MTFLRKLTTFHPRWCPKLLSRSCAFFLPYLNKETPWTLLENSRPYLSKPAQAAYIQNSH